LCDYSRDLRPAEWVAFDQDRLTGFNGQWQAMTPAEQERIMQQASHGHLSTADVGRLATNAQVSSVALTHLTPLPDGGDYSSWVDEVKKYYSGRVTVAKDLMSFEP